MEIKDPPVEAKISCRFTVIHYTALRAIKKCSDPFNKAVAKAKLLQCSKNKVLFHRIKSLLYTGCKHNAIKIFLVSIC